MKNLLILLFSMLIIIACSSDNNNNVNNNGDSPELLKNVNQAIMSVLEDMNDSMVSGTSELAQTGIDEARIREVLTGFLEKHPYIVDCCYVDTNGIMKYVEPEEYREYEGSDISEQDHIRQLLTDHQPIASNLFLAVEGFWSLDFEYPIFVNDKFAGSLSMLVEPKDFLEDIILPHIQGVPVDFWVMEQTGRIVYDPDEEEIGRNVFTDELYKQYPDLIKLAHTALEKESGEMSYQFYDTGMKKVIRKNAYWVSINTAGVKWKLFMTHPDNYVFETLSDDEINKMKNDLKKIATDASFVSYISNDVKDSVLSTLVDYYIKYPNIYTISWVDETVTVRYGLPKENSLENYHFTREKDTSVIKFIESVEKGDESYFTTELIEGKKGIFYMYPIKNDERYFGMLYYIHLTE
jgi:hypothetical protein